MKTVAVLFARADSVYKTLPQCDVYDIERDARTYAGHRAQKSTWLYIVGMAPADLPDVPLFLGRATHCIRPTKSYPRLPSVTKAEREHSPPAFAAWLVSIAEGCARQEIAA